jgi:hypothetical protein
MENIDNNNNTEWYKAYNGICEELVSKGYTFPKIFDAMSSVGMSIATKALTFDLIPMSALFNPTTKEVRVNFGNKMESADPDEVMDLVCVKFFPDNKLYKSKFKGTASCFYDAMGLTGADRPGFWSEPARRMTINYMTVASEKHSLKMVRTSYSDLVEDYNTTESLNALSGDLACIYTLNAYNVISSFAHEALGNLDRKLHVSGCFLEKEGAITFKLPNGYVSVKTLREDEQIGAMKFTNTNIWPYQTDTVWDESEYEGSVSSSASLDESLAIARENVLGNFQIVNSSWRDGIGLDTK